MQFSRKLPKASLKIQGNLYEFYCTLYKCVIKMIKKLLFFKLTPFSQLPCTFISGGHIFDTFFQGNNITVFVFDQVFFSQTTSRFVCFFVVNLCTGTFQFIKLVSESTEHIFPRSRIKYQKTTSRINHTQVFQQYLIAVV